MRVPDSEIEELARALHESEVLANEEEAKQSQQQQAAALRRKETERAAATTKGFFSGFFGGKRVTIDDRQANTEKTTAEKDNTAESKVVLLVNL
jgi:ribulose kinase